MRSISLDILRAIAVLLVLGAHIPDSIYFTKNPLSQLLSCWMRCGWTGVDLFFVLSGFLVSGLLFKEYQNYQTVDLKKFFIRRGLKIYPAFYAFLALSTIILWIEGRPLPSVKCFLGEIFYIQNYYSHIWEHTWSLAVEEQFYLLIGFLTVYLLKTRKNSPFSSLVPLSITTCVIILFFRTMHAYALPYTHQTHLFPTHFRLDSLLFGVLLSYLHHFRRDKTQEWVRKNKGILFLASVTLLAPVFRWSLFDPFMHSFGFTFLYLGYGGILLLTVYCIDEKRIANNKLAMGMANIGVYSYSIYLWHIVFARLYNYHIIPGNSFSICVGIFIYIAGSISAGIIMASIIEMPVLNLRNKLFPSRSGLPA